MVEGGNMKLVILGAFGFAATFLTWYHAVRGDKGRFFFRKEFTNYDRTFTEIVKETCLTGYSGGLSLFVLAYSFGIPDYWPHTVIVATIFCVGLITMLPPTALLFAWSMDKFFNL